MTGKLVIIGVLALAWFTVGCSPEPNDEPVVIEFQNTGECCDLPTLRMCAFQSHEQPCDPCPGGAEYDEVGRRSK